MIKLLIVDDEEKTREGLKKFIQWNTLGVEIIGLAEDGQDALAILERNPADIILTDVRMPKMDGIELAKKAREIIPDCEIVFISGYSEKAYLKSAIQLQAVDYIEKPIDIQEVISVFKKTVKLVNDKNEKKKNQNYAINVLNKSIPITKERIAIELLRKKADISELRESFELVTNNFPVNMDYITVIFFCKLDNTVFESDDNVLKSKIIPIIEKEFTVNKYNCLATVKDECQILVHVYKNFIKDNQSINSILEEIKHIYTNDINKGKGSIAIAVGQKVNGLASVYLSYQTAAIAAQKLFYSRNNMVFYINQSQRTFDFNDKAILEIAKKLKETEYCDVLDKIKKLILDIRSYDETVVNKVKDYFIKLSVEINKLELTDLYDKQENSTEDAVRAILETDSIEQIENYFTKKISEFIENKKSFNDKKRITCEIIEFIYKNYNDDNFSIDIIAKHMQLTPNYLSLLFKKETGNTINNFLAEVRIEKAKIYLKDRKIKLYEISDLVGYSDANYFTKIFKKIVGLTPSEYREKN